jgi:hypothetical protein
MRPLSGKLQDSTPALTSGFVWWPNAAQNQRFRDERPAASGLIYNAAMFQAINFIFKALTLLF